MCGVIGAVIIPHLVLWLLSLHCMSVAITIFALHVVLLGAIIVLCEVL